MSVVFRFNWPILMQCSISKIKQVVFHWPSNLSTSKRNKCSEPTTNQEKESITRLEAREKREYTRFAWFAEPRHLTYEKNKHFTVIKSTRIGLVFQRNQTSKQKRLIFRLSVPLCLNKSDKKLGEFCESKLSRDIVL